MTNLSISMVEPSTLQENRLTIHRFLRESCNEVSRQLRQGFSYLSGELKQWRQDTSTCFNNMLLPINNFLKDPLQIDKEMQQASGSDAGTIPAGNIIPLEIALQSPMEENY